MNRSMDLARRHGVDLPDKRDKDYWFSYENQKELHYHLAVELYLDGHGSWSRCIEQAKGMLDDFHTDVIHPKTRKW